MRGETVIFSRDRGSERHTAREPRRSADKTSDSTDRSGKSSRARASSRTANADESADVTRAEAETGLAAGPYDSSDAPDDVERLDLGSLHIPVIDGVSVRVQANNEGAVQQVALMYDDSALMLSVLAAPRTEGIWDEVRADIRKELAAGGAAVSGVNGEYGAEMRARVTTPEGPIDLLFVGVDGPRWLLRAIFQGPAAVDPAAAVPLRECLRGVVVDRGRDAMPVLELLPLRLPREIAEQARAQAAAAEANRPATNGVVPGSGPAASSGTGAARPRNVR
jgi:hypothetical protein